MSVNDSDRRVEITEPMKQALAERAAEALMALSDAMVAVVASYTMDVVVAADPRVRVGEVLTGLSDALVAVTAEVVAVTTETGQFAAQAGQARLQALLARMERLRVSLSGIAPVQSTTRLLVPPIRALARLGPRGDDIDHITGLTSDLQREIAEQSSRPLVLLRLMARNVVEASLEVVFYRIPALRGFMGDATRYIVAGLKWSGGAGVLLVSTIISSWYTGSPALIAIQAGIVTLVVTGVVGAMLAWARDRTRRPRGTRN